MNEEITGETSDGYHTFNELYDHRMALTAALARSITYVGGAAVRSKNHHPDDGPMFDGMFIVVITLPVMRGLARQVSYHYDLKWWRAFDCAPEVDSPPRWDGHTAGQSVWRLIHFATGTDHE